MLFGAGNQNRTDDLVITNDVLYRLSHTSIVPSVDDFDIITNPFPFVNTFFQFFSIFLKIFFLVNSTVEFTWEFTIQKLFLHFPRKMLTKTFFHAILYPYMSNAMNGSSRHSTFAQRADVW